MAATAQGQFLTEQQRQAQVALRDAFLAEFIRLWPLLDWARLDQTAVAWVRAVMVILRVYRQRSADIAASYYRAYRQAEKPGILVPAPELEFTGDEERRGQRPPDVVDLRGRGQSSGQDRGRGQDARTGRGQSSGQDRGRGQDARTGRGQDDNRSRLGREVKPRIDWTEFDRAAERSLISAGPGYVKMLTQRGQDEQTAMAKGLVATSGAAGRQVLNGGRETALTLVDSDETALGWVRVTDGDPCYFCAMLASRGPAYKSEATASFQAHDHCACTAEPVFSRSARWPGQAKDYQRLWNQNIAGRYSGAEARRAWRRLFEQLQREGQLPTPLSA